MQTHTLFFSPTQTGATVAQAIQKGLQTESGETIDITDASIERRFSPDDVVIVAMPVYSSRLPPIAATRFKAVCGNGAKAVAVAMYGNAKFGDALLELTDLCTEQGFEVIAGATFIGEHSFTMEEFPIAVGRPDAADLQKATDFAGIIQARLNGDEPLATPALPGSHPYSRDAMNPPGTAATGTNQDNCTRCGRCETVCPTSAITMTESGPLTDDSKCIWCSACVKACPSHARTFTLPKIAEIAEQLHANFQTRQEPEWFLAERSVDAYVEV